MLRFVDREEELGKLLELAERGFYPVLYIYGPEGCGKTRLLREFIDRVRDRDDFVAIYIDAQSVSSIEEAVYAPPKLLQLIANAIQAMHEVVGRALAKLLPHIVKKFFEAEIRGKHVVIAIDDVARPLGFDVIESYAKKLLDLVEWLMSRGARSAFVLTTTSEGQSLDILSRHSYVSINLIWNLPKDAFEELAQQMNPPSRGIVEEVWRLVGGNPRRLIEIATSYSWCIDAWLSRLRERIEMVYRKIRSKNLCRHLMHVIEDPDYLYTEASREVEELYRLLLDENLVLYKKISTISGRYVAKDLDLGIGEYVAWQIPAYKHLFKEIVSS